MKPHPTYTETTPTLYAAGVFSASPTFAPIPIWANISGMSRTATYDALGRGDLKAIKVGKRILIDVQHGLAWLRSRPPAQIRAPKIARVIAAKVPQ